MSKKRSTPRILVLSSVSPTNGPAIIGAQVYTALKRKGLDVDFMTKYPDHNHPEYLWVIKKEGLLMKVRNSLRWFYIGGRPSDNSYPFFYTKEKWPPVPSRLVVRAIKKQYDLVYIVFWQGLLNFDTIERIYDKLHCQIQISVVDYSPMTGGCHFTGGCMRYKVGCGKCPAFHSTKENDFTAQNVKYRQRVYQKVTPIVYGNQHMLDFYKDSFLLKDAHCELSPSYIIDTDMFRPLSQNGLREKFRIPKDKKMIIFFGCQNLNDERKGVKYLLESLNILYQMIGPRSDGILVITAGKSDKTIRDAIPFPIMEFGYVRMEELPGLYSLATCFVCPSINDAGPMMVNQSLCCGTPVVGFDMGSVKQMVKDKGTGICVPLYDSQALAEGIYKVLTMPADKYIEMSKRARSESIRFSSFEAHADLILSVYRKYKRFEE